MNPTDKTAPSQTDSLAFDFDLPHSPEKVWRALTDPALLAEWLLPVIGLKLEPGAAFTFKTQPLPRVGRHRELPDARDRRAQKAQLCVGRRRHGHRRHLHAHAHGVGHSPVPRALGLQAGPEAELRWSALRLEADGRQARRAARVFNGGHLELEQRGSPDPPLGVDCLHGGRHRQRRRPWESRSSPPRASAVLGEPPGAHPARLARAHGALPVRASLRRQVAQRATHRLMPSGAPTQQLIIQQSNKEGDEPRIDRVNTDLIHPSTRKGRTTDRHG